MKTEERRKAAWDCAIILLAFIVLVAALAKPNPLAAVVYVLFILTQLVRLGDRCSNQKNWTNGG